MSVPIPHILIVESRFYDDVADFLLQGAQAALKEARVTWECITVAGALEIPAVMAMAVDRKAGSRFAAFVALGCVIRGETSHYDIVAGESARALMDLTIRPPFLCLGNGILTCENKMQALRRADPAQKNKGRDAVLAALGQYEIRNRFSGGAVS